MRKMAIIGPGCLPHFLSLRIVRACFLLREGGIFVRRMESQHRESQRQLILREESGCNAISMFLLKCPVFFFHKTFKVNAVYPKMIADIGDFCGIFRAFLLRYNIAINDFCFCDNKWIRGRARNILLFLLN